MRDVIAGLLAALLLFAAASLGTTLQAYRRRRQRARDSQRERGRTIVAEIPSDDDLVLFSEDDVCFYYGTHAIPKTAIMAVRVLINGSPIAASERPPAAGGPAEAGRHARMSPTSFEDRPEGIARDRWDVAIEMDHDTMLVECGAIRERVSQELARAVFDAVRRTVELTTRLP